MAENFEYNNELVATSFVRERNSMSDLPIDGN